MGSTQSTWGNSEGGHPHSRPTFGRLLKISLPDCLHTCHYVFLPFLTTDTTALNTQVPQLSSIFQLLSHGTGRKIPNNAAIFTVFWYCDLHTKTLGKRRQI